MDFVAEWILNTDTGLAGIFKNFARQPVLDDSVPIRLKGPLDSNNLPLGAFVDKDFTFDPQPNEVPCVAFDYGNMLEAPSALQVATATAEIHSVIIHAIVPSDADVFPEKTDPSHITRKSAMTMLIRSAVKSIRTFAVSGVSLENVKLASAIDLSQGGTDWGRIAYKIDFHYQVIEEW